MFIRLTYIGWLIKRSIKKNGPKTEFNFTYFRFYNIFFTNQHIAHSSKINQTIEKRKESLIFILHLKQNLFNIAKKR